MKTALICLDVQDDFLGNTLDYVAPLCQRYLNNEGGQYDAIVLTRWVYDEVKDRNTLLLSDARATVVEKTTYSAFTEDTRRILETGGIEEVHISGVDSEGSVLATMFSLLDAGYRVKILERLVASYHGRNWESMMIARHVLGAENVISKGGGRVYA